MRLAAWLKQNHVSRTEFARRTGLRCVNGRAQAREHDRLWGESTDREQHDGRIGGGSSFAIATSGGGAIISRCVN